MYNAPKKHTGLKKGLVLSFLVFVGCGSAAPEDYRYALYYGDTIHYSVLFALLAPTIIGYIYDRKYLYPKHEGYIINVRRKQEELQMYRRQKNDEYKKKYNILQNPHVVNCIKGESGVGKIINNKSLYMWLDENDLCFANTNYCEDIGKNIIPINTIKFFTRLGDMYTETNISGGGGGGSSIGGAIIGGMIAGETGAIIGSRREIDPIQTQNKVIDRRETVLEIIEGEDKNYLFFDSKAYEAFLKLLPQKEMSFIQKANINDENDIYMKIEQLSKLKDKNFITEEEFEEKKKILLDKI